MLTLTVLFLIGHVVINEILNKFAALILSVSDSPVLRLLQVLKLISQRLVFSLHCFELGVEFVVTLDDLFLLVHHHLQLDVHHPFTHFCTVNSLAN